MVKKTLYQVGSLTYTRSGIAVLFSWLLWGDFVFNFMEIVAGNFIPLKLKQLESPNWLIGLVVTTVPSIIGMTLSPVVSASSDRARTRWGRRIPYLLVATPFVTLTLIFIGACDSLGLWLKTAFFSNTSTVTVSLYLMGIFVIAFQFLNVFITNIYIYLLNDVVPRELLSRFMALFKIVGILATSGFQFFLFGKAETHMREVFLGCAILYGLVFTLMCLRVREGTYDPPEVKKEDGRIVWSEIRAYVAECFYCRFYWYFFLANMFWGLSFAVVSFRVFFAESVGLNLDEFGKLMGAVGIASAVLLYPAAALADRWHPLRVMLLGLALLVLVVPMQLVFIAFDLPVSQARGIYMVLFVLHITVQVLCNASLMPMFMKVLPQDRFGQFCSANGLVSAAAMIVAGVLAGLWLDWLDERIAIPLYQYRYLPLWVTGCLLLAFVLMAMLYREWRKREAFGKDRALLCGPMTECIAE